jgi:hypothetical protein
MHFALNQDTNQQIMGDYLNWFVALKLLAAQDKATILGPFTAGGPSTCVLRTTFGDAECEAMFFDQQGKLRTQQYYLEIGRQALRALLDPAHKDFDRIRYQIVDDKLWPAAASTGANVNLGTLVGLSTSDVKVRVLVSDVKVIKDWAEAMVGAGALVQDVRSFVGKSDPATIVRNPDFKTKRDALQRKLASVVKASTMQFDEPFGMVSLFWASGSGQTAFAKATAKNLTVQRGVQPAPPAHLAED